MSDWTDFKKEIIIKTRRLQKRYNCVNNTEINNLIVKLQKQEGYSEINNIRRELYTQIDKHITPEIHLICSVNRKTKDGIIYESINPQIIEDITDKKIRELIEYQRQYCHDERYNIEFIMEKGILNNSQYGSYTTIEKRDCTQYVMGLLENLEFHTAYEQYTQQGVAQE
ncbi:MAG: hypothetical protein BZ134_00150 [Methanosphaera sp. SHI1033]|nr:MAG: hypothetical protein BZ134_00150 [Methanosphaera sp. SHI1033]